ncbi:MAG: radical SAM protein, partial [Acidilobaceae archaeon]
SAEASELCPFSCGLCSLHENAPALVNIVVTNRCDLSCWYCFFYMERAGYLYEPSIEEIEFMAERVGKQKYPAGVQLTGGEPLLREDLVEIVRAIRDKGVPYVQLNTNGIRLAVMFLENEEKAVNYAKSLAEAGVSAIYMSFDGVTPETNWKNHYEAPFALEAFRRAELNVVLVPTLLRGVNDHELGDMIRFAGKHIEVVRGVNVQPVSFTGRASRAERERYRITIPDVMRAVEDQTSGEIPRKSWFPVPIVAKLTRLMDFILGGDYLAWANHPVCGAATFAIVAERDENHVPRRFIALTDFFDVEGFIEYVDELRIEVEKRGGATLLDKARLLASIRRFVDASKLPRDIKPARLLAKFLLGANIEAVKEFLKHSLLIGAMHFMDLYNYDVERVKKCNILYALPDGRLVPFCAFNVLPDRYREEVQRRFSKPVTKASTREVFKYDRGKYIESILKHPIYLSYYRGILSGL